MTRVFHSTHEPESTQNVPKNTELSKSRGASCWAACWAAAINSCTWQLPRGTPADVVQFLGWQKENSDVFTRMITWPMLWKKNFWCMKRPLTTTGICRHWRIKLCWRMQGFFCRMCTGTSRCFFVRVPVSTEWTEFRKATLCVRCFFSFGPISNLLNLTALSAMRMMLHGTTLQVSDKSWKRNARSTQKARKVRMLPILQWTLQTAENLLGYVTSE